MPVYTIVGWLSVSRTGAVHYADAGAALAATGIVARGVPREWRFVCAFAGRHRPSAWWHQVEQTAGRPLARPAEPYTAVGFWRASGEAIAHPVKAGDGVETMKVALAQLGTAREVQLVLALHGPIEASLTAENLPYDWAW